MNKNKRIYLDHAATTYMDPKVRESMKPYWEENFGNPSSIYEEGREAKRAVSDVRIKVAETINGRPDEIIFTSGGTESDNLAILGAARSYKDRGNHVITSKIEHHAVLDACKQLEKEGFEISYIDVDENGILDLKQLKEELRKETILVSIMYANNEIGTIQPIKEIAKAVRAHKKAMGDHESHMPLLHTDAVQAPSYLDLNVLKLGVDLMTLNGSKIYGPKGVGVLFKKRGIKIDPLIYGGGQEAGIRSGTENVAGIVGFAKALELAAQSKEKESARLTELRDYFIENILKALPEARLNGSKTDRLPNNINISVRGIEGESMVLYMDAKGVACSTGSACTSDVLEASHVIQAIKSPHKYAHGSLRFTMGKKTKKADIDYVLKVLPEILNKLRVVSAIK